MAAPINPMIHLSELYQKREPVLRGSDQASLQKFRSDAFAMLNQVSFPDRKHEDWKYTPVSRLMSTTYGVAQPIVREALPAIPDLSTYVIPVINGIVDIDKVASALLNTGVRIYALGDVFDSPDFRETFEAVLSQYTANSARAFDYLNFAFHARGYWIDIPAGLILDKPLEIQVQHIADGPSFSHPLCFIRFGKNSQTTLFERFEHHPAGAVREDEQLLNPLSFYSLQANADVRHVRWQDLPENQSMVYRLLTHQKRDSRLITLGFDWGGKVIRNNVEVELEESNTYTSLQGAYMAKGKQSMDHQTRIHHRVPHGESHEWYKGILDDQASAAFNGKVMVAPDAQKTNAFQQNDTLVVSGQAVMNSKPQLEIFADDVKCSHGATIGQLDQRSLFYLKSRGLEETKAIHMLKAAFLTVILEQIPVTPLRSYIASKMGIVL